MDTKPLKKKRYIIYTRCSTDEQAQGDFTTLDAQAHHCKNMIDAFGYEMANFGKGGIIYDDGYSGKDLNRPGMQSILNDIQRQKSFDGVIFFRLDRLTRNPRDLYALIDLFREHEIDFISVRENLDSSTAIGRVVIGILGLLSAFERELTGERVKASCVARVRQGKWVGGTIPFGYKLIDDGPPLPNGRQPHKLAINNEIGTFLKLAWKLAAENKPLSVICNELTRLAVPVPHGKGWHKQSLVFMIKNPFYKGIIRYAGETHKGRHPALIDDNLWEKANKMIIGKIPRHRFIKKPKDYTYLLSGLLRCGECGSYYVSYFAYGRHRNKFYYYTCSRAKQALGCKSTKFPATQLDAAVVDFFNRASKDQDIIVKAIGDAILDSKDKLGKIQKEIRQVEEKLKTAREKADKLLSLAMEGTISKGPAYRAKMDAADSEIITLEDGLSKLEAQRSVAQMTANSGEFLYSNIRFAMKYLDQAPHEAQKALLQALIKTITMFDDHVELRMYVGQPFAEIACNLPEIPHNNPGNTPENETGPQNNCGALVADARDLTERPRWLPILDDCRTTRGEQSRTTERQEVVLLIKLYKRRQKGMLLSLGEPFPKKGTPKPPHPKVAEALACLK